MHSILHYNTISEEEENATKIMSSFESQSQKDVSESAYEFLLGEILSLKYSAVANDQNAYIIQRLDALGYDVGYRCVEVQST